MPQGDTPCFEAFQHVVHALEQSGFHGDAGLVKVEKRGVFFQVVGMVRVEPEANLDHGPGPVGDRAPDMRCGQAW